MSLYGAYHDSLTPWQLTVALHTISPNLLPLNLKAFPFEHQLAD